MKEDVFFCNDIEIEDELIKKKIILIILYFSSSKFLSPVKPVNNHKFYLLRKDMTLHSFAAIVAVWFP